MGRRLTAQLEDIFVELGVSDGQQKNSSSDSADEIRTRVLSWFSVRMRDLPWRHERDPWKILVSEIMLQQTSVNRVMAAWHRFVETFPTVQACAEVELGDVLRMWQGLGYPRRARNMHAAARMIVSDFDGSVPSSVDELLTLPGIGPYTARAVVAFAFEGEAAVVDVNVARVLRRLVGRSLRSAETQMLADVLLPRGQSWAWNQALMDLGATVCRRRPMCELCPVQSACRWHGSGPDPAEPASPIRRVSFEGSGRQARGRLLKALIAGPVSVDVVSSIMDRPEDVAAELVQSLVQEGLIRCTDDCLHL